MYTHTYTHTHICAYICYIKYMLHSSLCTNLYKYNLLNWFFGVSANMISRLTTLHLITDNGVEGSCLGEATCPSAYIH